MTERIYTIYTQGETGEMLGFRRWSDLAVGKHRHPEAPLPIEAIYSQHCELRVERPVARVDRLLPPLSAQVPLVVEEVVDLRSTAA